MKGREIGGRFIVGLLCLAVVWGYSRYSRPLPTAAQDAFEEWVSEVEREFLKSRQKDFPRVTVRLFSVDDSSIGWETKNGRDYQSRSRVLRILSQMREAELFGSEAAPRPEDKNIFVIQVETPGSMYSTRVAAAQFQQNLKAKILLQLMQLYGRPSESTPPVAPAASPPMEKK